MNRYREHRIPARSAECRMVGDAPTPPEEIERLVRRAREAGVVVFTRKHLESMAPGERAIVEGAHRRICERGGR